MIENAPSLPELPCNKIRYCDPSLLSFIKIALTPTDAPFIAETMPSGVSFPAAIFMTVAVPEAEV